MLMSETCLHTMLFPPHYGEGIKGYIVLQYKLRKALQFAGKLSMDAKKNEWRLQVLWQWGS